MTKKRKFRSISGVGPSIAARFGSLMGHKSNLSVQEVLDKYPSAKAFFDAASKAGVSTKSIRRRVDRIYELMSQSCEVQEKTDRVMMGAGPIPAKQSQGMVEMKQQEAVAANLGQTRQQAVQVAAPGLNLAETNTNAPVGLTNRLTAEGVRGQNTGFDTTEITNGDQLNEEHQQLAVDEALANPVAPAKTQSTAPDFVTDQVLTVQQKRLQELNTSQVPLQQPLQPILPAAAYTNNYGAGVRQAKPADRSELANGGKEVVAALDETDALLYVDKDRSDAGRGAHKYDRTSMYHPDLLADQGIDPKTFQSHILTTLLKGGWASSVSAALDLGSGYYEGAPKQLLEQAVRTVVDAQILKPTLLSMAIGTQVFPSTVASAITSTIVSSVMTDLKTFATEGDMKDLTGFITKHATRRVAEMFGDANRIYDDVNLHLPADGTGDPNGTAANAHTQRQAQYAAKIQQVEIDSYEEDERSTGNELIAFMPMAAPDDVMLQPGEIEEKRKNQTLFDDFKPTNWPLGSVDNKLFVSNLINTGIRYSGNLCILPMIKTGGLLSGGQGCGVRPTGIYPSFQRNDMKQSLNDVTFIVTLKLKHLHNQVLDKIIADEAQNCLSTKEFYMGTDPLFVYAEVSQGVSVPEEPDTQLFNPLVTEPMIKDLERGGNGVLRITEPAPADYQNPLTQIGRGRNRHIQPDLTLFRGSRRDLLLNQRTLYGF